MYLVIIWFFQTKHLSLGKLKKTSSMQFDYAFPPQNNAHVEFQTNA